MKDQGFTQGFSQAFEGLEKTTQEPPPPPLGPQIRAALETTIGYPQTRAEVAELRGAVRQLVEVGATGDEVRARVALWPGEWEPATWASVARKWSYLGKLAQRETERRAELSEHEAAALARAEERTRPGNGVSLRDWLGGKTWREYREERRGA